MIDLSFYSIKFVSLPADDSASEFARSAFNKSESVLCHYDLSLTL